jgi:hypothetical protein
VEEYGIRMGGRLPLGKGEGGCGTVNKLYGSCEEGEDCTSLVSGINNRETTCGFPGRCFGQDDIRHLCRVRQTDCSLATNKGSTIGCVVSKSTFLLFFFLVSSRLSFWSRRRIIDGHVPSSCTNRSSFHKGIPLRGIRRVHGRLDIARR